MVKYVVSGKAEFLLTSLKQECVEAADLVIRKNFRRVYKSFEAAAVLQPPFGLPGPVFELPKPPILLEGSSVGYRHARQGVLAILLLWSLRAEMAWAILRLY